MKILWVKADLLHPTTRGGKIRSLEMLRRLHRRNEIHYVGLLDPAHPEAVALSAEYCSHVYPIEHRAPRRRSLAFAGQVLKGAVSKTPVLIDRYRSEPMRRCIAELTARHRFDAVVCDFLVPARNMPRLDNCVLFQHNVETMIWERHASSAGDLLRRSYFRLQARRMFAFEQAVCRAVCHVVAVSEADARAMQRMFGVERISHVPTGVDVDYFTPPAAAAHSGVDLVFVGAMDWMPNVDGVIYFVREVLPLIRRGRPECSFVIAGKDPAPEIVRLGRDYAGVVVTGTVPDVRPYLWGSSVSVVPLRIGGGTRLKIYESMAARVPVVSTTVGAEGLTINPPWDIRIADNPEAFAGECLVLLETAAARRSQANAAWELVASRFSWERVAEEFEAILHRSTVSTHRSVS